MPREPSDHEVDEVRRFIFAGKKISAIKSYRQATGCDLKHGKDAVEDLQRRLWQETPEKFASPPDQSSGRGLLLIFLLVAVGMAIWGLVQWIAAAGPK